MQEHNLRGNL